MKKLLAIFAIFVLLGTTLATALPITIEKTEKTPLAGETGTFEGEIGHLQGGEWNAIGEISGTYELRNRFGIIDGEWEIIVGEQAGTTGILRVLFGRFILIGRITIDETGRKAPIIGFIFFEEETKKFGGRFMSLVGPALYFKGTYQEN